MTLDREMLDAFVPEFEAEAVRLAMVRDAAAAQRALDQLRAMAAALGAASLARMVEDAALALDPLDLPALHRAAEALARQARAVGEAGADVAAAPAAAAPAPVAPPPPAPSLDREILDALAPEFDAACAKLAAAGDAIAAGRALDGLRALAGAAGLASLKLLLDRALPLLDPFDPAGLRALSADLAAHAALIVAQGEDLPPPAAAPPPPAAGPAALDPEMLAAFAPEFRAGCARLAAATGEAEAARAADSLRAMAEALGLDSLRALLAEAPFDATALAAHAAAIAIAGQDLPFAPPAIAAKRRVLVVDDSAMMRRLVRETLATDPDFEVVGEAPDGMRGLAAMRDCQPDLTMLDIEMPELDGIGVMRRWALEGIGAVVIVSSAARPGSATAVEARRLGVAGIVGKPSGALSPDLKQRQGEALLRTARRAVGLPVEGAR